MALTGCVRTVLQQLGFVERNNSAYVRFLRKALTLERSLISVTICSKGLYAAESPVQLPEKESNRAAGAVKGRALGGIYKLHCRLIEDGLRDEDGLC